MSSVSKKELEDALRAAVARQSHKYQNYHAFHFRFEDDDTRADRDGTTFANLARIFCFPTPQTYVIPKAHTTPSFEVINKISAIISKASTAPGRSLVLIHYAGHGGASDSNELILNSTSGKKIAASRLVSLLVDETVLPFDAPLDIILIFDCCFSFLATRNPSPKSRIVEILTAGDDRDPIAFSAGTQLSFTSKVLVEVRKRAQNGEKFIEVADLIDTLRKSSPVKTPSYAAKVGMGSITLPLAQIPITPSTSPMRRNPPGLLATFSLHVSKTFSRDELKELVKWIGTFPKIKGASMKLENVKQTSSMVFIFEASRLSYLRICGLPGMILICENEPADFSWLFAPEPAIQMPTRGGPLFPKPLKENQPFGKQQK
ncbi:hypothetical protein DTO169E5_360 [Paecilomyces variotii]|nr:hypothetical protein DTO169E5_360 [Paecilomyces variotii]